MLKFYRCALYWNIAAITVGLSITTLLCSGRFKTVMIMTMFNGLYDSVIVTADMKAVI